MKSEDILLLDDGLLEVRVIKIVENDIHCEVINGGLLTSHKGLNLPSTTLGIPAITEKDKDDVKFGISLGVDWVALSFVRSAKDIHDLREIIRQSGKEEGDLIRIMAKIEKHEAIKNIDEIIAEADGIMIARGDLGIETPAEEVPLVQKRIIEKCLVAAKPVVVATQMLDSMIRNPRPTRAEVSDVANAVIDHTDAVMLSGESASGKFPLEAVETMARIIHETEISAYDDMQEICHPHSSIGLSVGHAVTEAARILAEDTKAKAILVASLSGNTGRAMSSFRPEVPIIVAVCNERIEHQLNISWGIIPFVIPKCETLNEVVEHGFAFLKKKKILKKGEAMIVVAGEPVGASGNSNTVEVREMK